MASPFLELEVGPRLVRVTNPDKVLFPQAGVKKLDLVQYYLDVGEGIVRALFDRPTQLRRFPDGIEGEQIYQKRVPEKRPEWVEAARVTFPSGRHADELCVTELAQVAWAANLAVVDFHPWPSRRGDTEHPDELRIDIDPQPGTDFADGKRVAATVREVLAEMGYTGWPKTSGNRGIHVACRIEPNWEFPVVRRCALAFAREVERRLPELVTTAWWKEERGERVFIDYNQNARDRTIASAYSVRARPDATVSAPVTWDELPDVETEDFTLFTMPGRFAELGDVQAGIDGGAALGGDLVVQRRGLLAALAHLPAQQRDLALHRRPARLEQRALALERLGDPALAFAPQNVGREGGPRGVRRLGEEARRPGALGDQLGAQLVHGRIHADILDDHQRLSLPHLLAVAHADLAHDAAFQVLHHLAVQVDLDEALRDDGARQRRERRPEGEAGDPRRNDEQARARDRRDAQLPFELDHAACLGRAVTRASISARGPNTSRAPSRSTSSLSTPPRSDGRWATTITVTPSSFRLRSALSSACSPSWSRFAFGSSSTTSLGLP
jgi:DNA ligase D-like protein (predicted polymerase)